MQIFKKKVESDEIIQAREDKYLNNKFECVEGISITSEWLYWKYTLELDGIIEDNGMYYVDIMVYGDSTSVKFTNTVVVSDNEFVYTNDYFEKEY